MSLKNIVVVSVLKHLSEIDSMCRLDKHSAHPNPQMTHTGTHRHAQARTHAHTHSRVPKHKYTQKRGRVGVERVWWTQSVGGQ